MRLIFLGTENRNIYREVLNCFAFEIDSDLKWESAVDDSESRNFLRNAMLADAFKVDAVNMSDFTSDMSHQKNAIYRVPLSEPSKEEDARQMANVSFSAVLKQHSEEADFDSDAAYEQCLTDARRLLRDPNYSQLLDLTNDLHFVAHAPVEALLPVLPVVPELSADQKANLFQQK